jgi:S1-C subfamily serine protease
VRPWLGINADEVQGRLIVSRVSPEGPAEKAGIKAGDLIVAVGLDAVRTQPEFYRKVWAYGAAGTDIPLRVLQDDIDVREISVHSMDRTAYGRSPATH